MFSLFRFHKQPKTHYPKIGLALGSGGSRGLAHIGVIKALVEHNIPIDYIAGSSAGALIGGLYAAFGNIAKVEELANELNYKEFLLAFTDPFPGAGVFKGEKVTDFLNKHLKKVTISELKTPFRAVATDVVSGQTVVLKEGDLATAIRASSSLPLLFQPVVIDAYHLVDGGVSMPVPVKVVRDMGADIVIAVNLYPGEMKKEKDVLMKPSFWEVGSASLILLLYHLSMANMQDADVVINPEVANPSLFDFVNGSKMIHEGEVVTSKVIPHLQQHIEKYLS